MHFDKPKGSSGHVHVFVPYSSIPKNKGHNQQSYGYESYDVLVYLCVTVTVTVFEIEQKFISGRIWAWFRLPFEA